MGRGLGFWDAASDLDSASKLDACAAMTSCTKGCDTESESDARFQVEVNHHQMTAKPEPDTMMHLIWEMKVMVVSKLGKADSEERAE